MLHGVGILLPVFLEQSVCPIFKGRANQNYNTRSAKSYSSEELNCTTEHG
jgi:hypothetical protein